MSFWCLQFSQKTNENNSNWGTIVVKSNFFVRFLGELKIPKRHFEINWPLLRSWKPHELLYAFELYILGVNWTIIIIFSLYQILVMDPFVDDVFKLNYRFANKISNLSSNFILPRLCLSFTAVQISNHIFSCLQFTLHQIHSF